MSEQSLINHAFCVLNASKDPLSFKDLFDATIKASGLELSEVDLKKKISSLYTQLLSDSRFTLLDDKKWDLSSRYAYEKTHKQYDFIEDDDEDEEIDEEEKELLQAELGESEERNDESDDEIDYDKPKDESEDF